MSTFVIGDPHGQALLLDRLLVRLPIAGGPMRWLCSATPSIVGRSPSVSSPPSWRSARSIRRSPQGNEELRREIAALERGQQS